MKINDATINLAKCAAEHAYYDSIAQSLIPEKGVAHDILKNIVWACEKNHKGDFWAAGDEHGYDYRIEIVDDVCHINEIKNSTGYHNHIEIRCDTIEHAADALRFLYC